MEAESIRRLLNINPFQPFELSLADGSKVLVHHPDYLLLFPNGKTALSFDKTGDKSVWINTSLIVRADSLQPADR
jgi:hypothetical protein